jgi:hypothetical protein
MTDHEREFTERKNIDVFVGTWNVNGKKVGENLTPWLRPRGQGKRPDVYVIGFQEMVELNAQSVLLNQAMPGIESKSKDWQNKIERVINKGIPETSEDRFVPLESGYLVGKGHHLTHCFSIFVKQRQQQQQQQVSCSVSLRRNDSIVTSLK